MTTNIGFSFFENLSNDLLGEITQQLPLADIESLYSTNKALAQRLDSLVPLEKRRDITQRSNLFLRYGPLLFSPSELTSFNYSQAHNVANRAFGISLYADKKIRDKIQNNPLDFFRHQNEEQLNQLASALVQNGDIDLLRLLLQSPRLIELSSNSMSLLCEYLGSIPDPALFGQLIMNSAFANLTDEDFHNLCRSRAFFARNHVLFERLVTSDRFNQVPLEIYNQLLNFAALGESQSFQILTRHPFFIQIDHQHRGSLFEAAIGSDHPAIIDQIYGVDWIETLNMNHFERALQESCYRNKTHSIQRLITDPRINDIQPFSLSHAIDSLCRARSDYISHLIESNSFNLLSYEDFLELLQLTVTQNHESGFQAFLRSEYFHTALENDEGFYTLIEDFILQRGTPVIKQIFTSSEIFRG